MIWNWILQMRSDLQLTIFILHLLWTISLQHGLIFFKQPFLWLDTPQVHDDCCASHSLWPKFPHSPLIHGRASSHSPSHASLIHQGLRSCTPFITPLPQFPRSLPVTTLRSHSPGPNFPPYISIMGATCPQVTKHACTLVPWYPHFLPTPLARNLCFLST